jgi:hypothetical protein
MGGWVAPEGGEGSEILINVKKQEANLRFVFQIFFPVSGLFSSILGKCHMANLESFCRKIFQFGKKGYQEIC